MRRTYTFIDLFAGAGGFSEGFLQAEEAGARYEFLLASDINENCELTHVMRYNRQLGLDIEFLRRDISEEGFVDELERRLAGRQVDVVCGGPPCQSFSLAGRRRRHDKKDDLFAAYLRVIERLRPRYFVMENVAGMLTKEGGRIAQSVVEEIRSIIDPSRLGSLIAIAGEVEAHAIGEHLRDAALARAIAGRLAIEASGGMAGPAAGRYVADLERLFRRGIASTYSYRESKTSPDIATVRHGLRMLARAGHLARLRRTIVHEKSHSDIDNDAFVESFDGFLSTISTGGIIDVVLEHLDVVLDESSSELVDLRTGVQALGWAVGECIDTLIDLATGTPLAASVEGEAAQARLYRIEAPIVVNASDFGVPQDRKRVLFIGCRNDQPFVGEVEPTVAKGEKVTVIEALHDLDFIGSGEHPTQYPRSAGSDANAFNRRFRSRAAARDLGGKPSPIGKSYAKWSRAGRLPGRFSVGPCTYVRSTDAIDDPLQNHVAELHNHQSSSHNAKVTARLREIQRAKGYGDDVREMLAGKGLETGKRNYSLLNPAGQSPTVMTISDDYIHYRVPRALTVREMARLQGFDDSFVFQGKRTTGGSRRKDEVPQLTLVGNAVPPPMARAVAATLLVKLSEADAASREPARATSPSRRSRAAGKGRRTSRARA